MPGNPGGEQRGAAQSSAHREMSATISSASQKQETRMRGNKRKSGSIDNGAVSSQSKRSRNVSPSDRITNIRAHTNTLDSSSPPDGVVEKPRLTTPDVEFDYDRTQLRDPRPTPGRGSRPRYEDSDIPADVLAHLKATRTIPGPPPRPKGRLTNAVKDEMYQAEARANPLKTFHDLYRCRDKGRRGSPTYDAAGFQLDFEKVWDWFHPRAYNKSRIVSGMERHLNQMETEEKQMFRLFFKDWDKEKTENNNFVEEYMKDQVSKDIGIPWHQIGPKEVRVWRQKGFQPVVYEEWWREPNEEEKRRMDKMCCGASLRRHT